MAGPSFTDTGRKTLKYSWKGESRSLKEDLRMGMSGLRQSLLLSFRSGGAFSKFWPRRSSALEKWLRGRRGCHSGASETSTSKSSFPPKYRKIHTHSKRSRPTEL